MKKTRQYDVNASYATRTGAPWRDERIEARARKFKGEIIDTPFGLGSQDFIIRFECRTIVLSFRDSLVASNLVHACEVVPSDKNPMIGAE